MNLKLIVMKWNNVNEKLPIDDKFILLAIKSYQNRYIYAIGSFNNDKFYAKGGIGTKEVVTKWASLPDLPVNE